MLRGKKKAKVSITDIRRLDWVERASRPNHKIVNIFNMPK